MPFRSSKRAGICYQTSGTDKSAVPTADTVLYIRHDVNAYKKVLYCCLALAISLFVSLGMFFTLFTLNGLSLIGASSIGSVSAFNAIDRVVKLVEIMGGNNANYLSDTIRGILGLFVLSA